MKSNQPLEGTRKTCVICGREFFAQGDWVYVKKIYGENRKMRKLYFCSWKCRNKGEKVK